MRSLRLLARILVVLVVPVSWAFVIRPTEVARGRLPSVVPHSPRKGVARKMTMGDDSGSDEGSVESDSFSSSDAASSSSPAEADAETVPTTLASSTEDEADEPGATAAPPAKPLVPFESAEPESWRETEPPPYVSYGQHSVDSAALRSHY